MEPIVPLIHLERGEGLPLHRQLYAQLRHIILSGWIGSGQRLPPIRSLATELGVSRTTVENAFDQLLAEGYVEGRVGAGTFVAAELPEEIMPIAQGPATSAARRRYRGLSNRGHVLAAIPHATDPPDLLPPPFRPGVPDVAHLPLHHWSRIARRHLRSTSPAVLLSGETGGFEPLRRVIARRVGATRGVRCSPDQVIIVTGSSHGLALAASALLDPGDPAWIENPSHSRARAALTAAGAQLVPVPMDEEGLNVDAGRGRSPRARLAYVMPSHQYPLGVTMTLPRRLELLEWASETDAWILEDDVDSEYRYTGPPLAALQGLDNEHRVIYVGSFGGVLFPGLRIGYLVAPPDLVGPLRAVVPPADHQPPTLLQAVLADFIEAGHLDHHIRQMRALYAKRQATLLDAARAQLDDLLDVQPVDTGMHLVGWLPSGVDDRAVASAAREFGLFTPALSSYGIEPHPRSGLLLGFAAFDEDQIRAGVRRLASALGRVVGP
jgi:GntR family transcriptional regulator / MocR family aminotransferase